MTKSVFEIAREAGIRDVRLDVSNEQLERFAALIREDEREKIALAHKIRPRGKSVYHEFLAEREKQQEPVAWMHIFMGVAQINTTPPEVYGDNWTHKPLYFAQPDTQQEPVAVGAYEVVNEAGNEWELVYPEAIHKYKMIPEQRITQTFYTAPPTAEVPALYQQAALELHKFQEATGCDIADELPSTPTAAIAARQMRDALFQQIDKWLIDASDTDDESYRSGWNGALFSMKNAIAYLPIPGEEI